MANISGWYYDNQLNNPLTSVSLHANMMPEEGENGTWTWKQISDTTSEVVDQKNRTYKFLGDKEDETIKGFFSEEKKEKPIYYNKYPICQSICNEDFIVNISNDWSDFGVDNIAGSLWNTIRQIGPYKSEIEKAIKPIIQEAASKKEDFNKDTASWSDWANHGINWLTENYNEAFGSLGESDYFNRALIMQGTKFSYYGGSNVNFTNLGMRFTMFPKLGEDGKYIDVLEQAENLYKYLIGSTEMFDTKKIEKTTGVEAPEIVKKMLMWQKAPMDFSPNLQQYDIIQQGTLKLKIGSLYSISNLVCNDANLVFSRQMVKLKNKNGDIKLSPLYCDVAISLRPVSKYSEKLLKSLVSRKRDTHLDKEKDINDSLKKEIKSIKEQYGL